MKFKYVIGMDMAKLSFALAVHNHSFEKEYDNTSKSIRQMLKTISKVLQTPNDQCLFCLEHTGLYSLEMIKLLSAQQIPYVVLSGLELKKSQGMRRGKSDPLDARSIGEFAYMRQDKLQLHQLPSPALIKMNDLLSLRALHVRTRAGYKARYGEQKRILKQCENPILFQSQKKMISFLTKEIDRLEEQIHQVIAENKAIKYYFDLICSVTGVGLVVASKIIVKTNCFTSFRDWRKFGCYSGTVPFPNESGNNKGPRRIHHMADREMKVLLTLAAQCAIIYDPEIKHYYNRKLKEGKTKKCARNAVRNKLLARIFSVAKRGTPYVVLHKYAA